MPIKASARARTFKAPDADDLQSTDAAKVSQAERSAEVTLEHDEEPQQIIIQDNFMEGAADLTEHFESRYP